IVSVAGPRDRTHGAAFMKSVALVALTGFLVAGCATGLSREDLAEEYVNIGNAYLDLDEPETAAEYFARASDLNPDLPLANFNLARAWLEVDRIAESIELLEELAEEDPENTLVLRTLGVAYYRGGDTNAARENFEAALEQNERDVDALYNLGVIEAEEGRYERAVDYLERARDIDDGEDIARELGMVLFELDREQEAQEYLSGLSELDEDAPVLRRLGAIAAGREAYDEAVDWYERAADADSDDPDARFELARIRLAFIDEQEEGVANLRAALDRGFDNEDAIDSLRSQLEGETLDLVEGVLIDEGLLPEQEER
ncbi:MAG: tetratricopeptide repeat protein, partial [Spirochaetales bacterium]